MTNLEECVAEIQDLIAQRDELADALQDIHAQLNGLEGRQYQWIRTRAETALKTLPKTGL